MMKTKLSFLGGLDLVSVGLVLLGAYAWVGLNNELLGIALLAFGIIKQFSGK